MAGQRITLYHLVGEVGPARISRISIRKNSKLYEINVFVILFVFHIAKYILERSGRMVGLGRE